MRRVALLRAINVGGNRKLPMADLRALAAGLGLEDPRTYVASGNLVFASERDPAALEAQLEQAIAARFGFPVQVMVRTAGQWCAYRAANPFPLESAEAPSKVMLCVGKDAPVAAEVEALRGRAADNERVEVTGDAIWIWFGNGAGRSRIGGGPARSIWTARNWRTVVALGEMLDA